MRGQIASLSERLKDDRIELVARLEGLLNHITLQGDQYSLSAADQESLRLCRRALITPNFSSVENPETTEAQLQELWTAFYKGFEIATSYSEGRGAFLKRKTVNLFQNLSYLPAYRPIMERCTRLIDGLRTNIIDNLFSKDEATTQASLHLIRESAHEIHSLIDAHTRDAGAAFDTTQMQPLLELSGLLMRLQTLRPAELSDAILRERAALISSLNHAHSFVTKWSTGGLWQRLSTPARKTAPPEIQQPLDIIAALLTSNTGRQAALLAIKIPDVRTAFRRLQQALENIRLLHLAIPQWISLSADDEMNLQMAIRLMQPVTEATVGDSDLFMRALDSAAAMQEFLLKIARQHSGRLIVKPHDSSINLNLLDFGRSLYHKVERNLKYTPTSEAREAADAVQKLSTARDLLAAHAGASRDSADYNTSLQALQLTAGEAAIAIKKFLALARKESILSAAERFDLYSFSQQLELASFDAEEVQKPELFSKLKKLGHLLNKWKKDTLGEAPLTYSAPSLAPVVRAFEAVQTLGAACATVGALPGPIDRSLVERVQELLTQLPLLSLPDPLRDTLRSQLIACPFERFPLDGSASFAQREEMRSYLEPLSKSLQSLLLAKTGRTVTHSHIELSHITAKDCYVEFRTLSEELTQLDRAVKGGDPREIFLRARRAFILLQGILDLAGSDPAAIVAKYKKEIPTAFAEQLLTLNTFLQQALATEASGSCDPSNPHFSFRTGTGVAGANSPLMEEAAALQTIIKGWIERESQHKQQAKEWVSKAAGSKGTDNQLPEALIQRIMYQDLIHRSKEECCDMYATIADSIRKTQNSWDDADKNLVQARGEALAVLTSRTPPSPEEASRVLAALDYHTSLHTRRRIDREQISHAPASRGLLGAVAFGMLDQLNQRVLGVPEGPVLDRARQLVAGIVDSGHGAVHRMIVGQGQSPLAPPTPTRPPSEVGKKSQEAVCPLEFQHIAKSLQAIKVVVSNRDADRTLEAVRQAYALLNTSFEFAGAIRPKIDSRDRKSIAAHYQTSHPIVKKLVDLRGFLSRTIRDYDKGTCNPSHVRFCFSTLPKPTSTLQALEDVLNIITAWHQADIDAMPLIPQALKKGLGDYSPSPLSQNFLQRLKYHYLVSLQDAERPYYEAKILEMEKLEREGSSTSSAKAAARGNVLLCLKIIRGQPVIHDVDRQAAAVVLTAFETCESPSALLYSRGGLGNLIAAASSSMTVHLPGDLGKEVGGAMHTTEDRLRKAVFDKLEQLRLIPPPQEPLPPHPLAPQEQPSAPILAPLPATLRSGTVPPAAPSTESPPIAPKSSPNWIGSFVGIIYDRLKEKESVPRENVDQVRRVLDASFNRVTSPYLPECGLKTELHKQTIGRILPSKALPRDQRVAFAALTSQQVPPPAYPPIPLALSSVASTSSSSSQAATSPTPSSHTTLPAPETTPTNPSLLGTLGAVVYDGYKGKKTLSPTSFRRLEERMDAGFRKATSSIPSGGLKDEIYKQTVGRVIRRIAPPGDQRQAFAALTTPPPPVIAATASAPISPPSPARAPQRTVSPTPSAAPPTAPSTLQKAGVLASAVFDRITGTDTLTEEDRRVAETVTSSAFSKVDSRLGLPEGPLRKHVFDHTVGLVTPGAIPPSSLRPSSYPAEVQQLARDLSDLQNALKQPEAGPIIDSVRRLYAIIAALMTKSRENSESLASNCHIDLDTAEKLIAFRMTLIQILQERAHGSCNPSSRRFHFTSTPTSSPSLKMLNELCRVLPSAPSGLLPSLGRSLFGTKQSPLSLDVHILQNRLYYYLRSLKEEEHAFYTNRYNELRSIKRKTLTRKQSFTVAEAQKHFQHIPEVIDKGFRKKAAKILGTLESLGQGISSTTDGAIANFAGKAADALVSSAGFTGSLASDIQKNARSYAQKAQKASQRSLEEHGLLERTPTNPSLTQLPARLTASVPGPSSGSLPRPPARPPRGGPPNPPDDPPPSPPPSTAASPDSPASSRRRSSPVPAGESANPPPSLISLPPSLSGRSVTVANPSSGGSKRPKKEKLASSSAPGSAERHGRNSWGSIASYGYETITGQRSSRKETQAPTQGALGAIASLLKKGNQFYREIKKKGVSVIPQYAIKNGSKALHSHLQKYIAKLNPQEQAEKIGQLQPVLAALKESATKGTFDKAGETVSEALVYFGVLSRPSEATDHYFIETLDQIDKVLNFNLRSGRDTRVPIETQIENEKDRFVKYTRFLLPLKYIQESSLGLGPKELSYYTEMILEAEAAGPEHEDERIKSLLMASLERQGVNGWSLFWVKHVTFPISLWLAKKSLQRAMGKFINWSKVFIEKNNIDTASQFSYEVIQNTSGYFAILHSAFERVAKEKVTTGTINHELNKQLSLRAVNGNLTPSQLYDRVASKAIEQFIKPDWVPTFIVKWLLGGGKSIESMLDQTSDPLHMESYIHGLNCVIYNWLKDVLMTLQKHNGLIPGDDVEVVDTQKSSLKNMTKIQQQHLLTFIREAFNLLPKSECGSPTDLRKLLGNKPFWSELSESLDNKLNTRLAEGLMEVLGAGFQTIFEKGKMQSLLCDLVSVLNNIYQPNATVPKQVMKATEDGIQRLCHTIINLVLEKSLRNGLDFDRKNEMAIAAGYTKEMQEICLSIVDQFENQLDSLLEEENESTQEGLTKALQVPRDALVKMDELKRRIEDAEDISEARPKLLKACKELDEKLKELVRPSLNLQVEKLHKEFGKELKPFIAKLSKEFELIRRMLPQTASDHYRLTTRVMPHLDNSLTLVRQLKAHSAIEVIATKLEEHLEKAQAHTAADAEIAQGMKLIREKLKNNDNSLFNRWFANRTLTSGTSLLAELQAYITKLPCSKDRKARLNQLLVRMKTSPTSKKDWLLELTMIDKELISKSKTEQETIRTILEDAQERLEQIAKFRTVRRSTNIFSDVRNSFLKFCDWVQKDKSFTPPKLAVSKIPLQGVIARHGKKLAYDSLKAKGDSLVKFGRQPYNFRYGLFHHNLFLPYLGKKPTQSWASYLSLGLLN